MKPEKTFLVLALAAGLSLCAFEAQAKIHLPAKAKKVTVTGCLQKSDDPNEFSITGDGKTYDVLAAAKVALKDHVGHKVTITGTDVTKTMTEAEKNESVAGHLQVTSLKMVSTTCP